MKMFAYVGADFVPIAHPFICKKFVQLNIKLFNVNINFIKLITFAGRFFRFSGVSTALTPSLLGILVQSERASMVTKKLYCGTFSTADTFLMKSVESLT